MKRIKEILNTESYKNLKYKQMLDIAKEEFKNFDDEELKVRFLEEAFNKLDKKSLGKNSAHDCATVLVELGTFEGCQ